MLAPWKKSYDKPRQRVKKQRHYFANKGLWYLVKAMVFPVIVYGCESWTTKKPEHWRIDAFELWCWRRVLRVLWTVRRSNQSILKEINPEYSLEGLMLKLRLKYFGHLMRGTDSLEKTLMLGNKARGEDGWMPSPTQWTWVWTSSMWWWRTGRPGMLQSMESQRIRHDLENEQQQSLNLFPCNLFASFQQLYNEDTVKSTPWYEQMTLSTQLTWSLVYHHKMTGVRHLSPLNFLLSIDVKTIKAGIFFFPGVLSFSLPPGFFPSRSQECT